MLNNNGDIRRDCQKHFKPSKMFYLQLIYSKESTIL